MRCIVKNVEHLRIAICSARTCFKGVESKRYDRSVSKTPYTYTHKNERDSWKTITSVTFDADHFKKKSILKKKMIYMVHIFSVSKPSDAFSYLRGIIR